MTSRCTLAKTVREWILSEKLPFGEGSLEKEWGFLCACVSPATGPDRFVPLLNAGLDWNVLLALAEEHSVLGALAIRLRDLGFEAVPAPARERLLNRLRAQHMFALAMTADLFRVLEDFSRTGIKTVLVKGPLVS